VTTIHGYGRSLAGLVAAHLAVTLGVCGGLVLLLPAPALSQGLPATISAIAVTDCDASGNPAADYSLTGDEAGLSAPDCDDDGDDDDDAPTGSDAAIAVDPSRTTSDGSVIEDVHIDVEPWISRSVDGHSLRGPPAGDESSSDADDDYDSDDDDPAAEESDLLPPATSHQTCPLAAVEFITTSALRFSDHSLRAPPL
jgi:hypothetical protein